MNIRRNLNKLCEYAHKMGLIMGAIKNYRLGIWTAEQAISDIEKSVYRKIQDVTPVSSGANHDPYEGHEPCQANGWYRGD